MACCEQIYVDKTSGKLARRPTLDEVLRMLRSGDQLVITKLDRLGRSLEHLIELSNQLQVGGVDLVVLDQGIDTSTAVGGCSSRSWARSPSFLLSRHALMSERTRDGLEAARARGRTGGPKPKLGLRQARLAREMYEAGELTVAQIAAEFGVTRPTIYRHLDRLDEHEVEPARAGRRAEDRAE
jgi:DNA invertase Pin-like site-specific DNA recombinase